MANLVKTNEQPAKSLDDYFRKTKAKPSIYWLPLTEEQVFKKEFLKFSKHLKLFLFFL